MLPEIAKSAPKLKIRGISGLEAINRRGMFDATLMSISLN
jgi:hypothetical protein